MISGPSGVGKGTVCARLTELHPGIHIPVSATTRSPRPGEEDGVSYHFLTPDEFERLIASGQLLEHVVMYGDNCYGTLRSEVETALADGRTVVLEIDLQGARQIKQNMPEARLIFLEPPSWDELVRRLEGRGTEDEAAVARRLETARMELAARQEADFIVVNEDIEETVRALVGLMGL
ncbi:guanylate kinase [Arachnia propionica]|uniref:Guanylate kinase n=1 Tax=Arachnia propionica TaxID=1750 RepID=A0A3P1TE85_9ACTN|nr:guanylate kinase [Arachnia propionica]